MHLNNVLVLILPLKYISLYFTLVILITQELYSKTHLNDILLLHYSLYTLYFGIVTFHKMFYSCISTSSLAYA